MTKSKTSKNEDGVRHLVRNQFEAWDFLPYEGKKRIVTLLMKGPTEEQYVKVRKGYVLGTQKSIDRGEGRESALMFKVVIGGFDNIKGFSSPPLKTPYVMLYSVKDICAYVVA